MELKILSDLNGEKKMAKGSFYSKRVKSKEEEKAKKADLKKSTKESSETPDTTIIEETSVSDDETPTKEVGKIDDSLVNGNSTESALEQEFFKKALWVIGFSIIFFFLLFALGFFLVVKPSEKTEVPNLINMDYIDAKLELQNKGLEDTIQVRFTEDPLLKGKVINQSPRAGSSTRVGNNVTLTVSRGAVVDRVGNYVGQNIEEVRMNIQAMFTIYEPLLEITDVVYEESDQPAGTILAQTPEADYEISGYTELSLVVSRGTADGTSEVDTYIGKDYLETLNVLVTRNIPFIYYIDENADKQRSSRVVNQTPAPGEFVPNGSTTTLTISRPSYVDEESTFGLFSFQLPKYAVWVDVRVERKIAGESDSEVLFQMKHPGGQFSMPYLEKKGTILTFYVYDEEFHKMVIQ